jgi:hypothetical protein
MRATGCGGRTLLSANWRGRRAEEAKLKKPQTQKPCGRSNVSPGFSVCAQPLSDHTFSITAMVMFLFMFVPVVFFLAHLVALLLRFTRPHELCVSGLGVHIRAYRDA